MTEKEAPIPREVLDAAAQQLGSPSGSRADKELLDKAAAVPLDELLNALGTVAAYKYAAAALEQGFKRGDLPAVDGLPEYQADHLLAAVQDVLDELAARSRGER